MSVYEEICLEMIAKIRELVEERNISEILKYLDKKEKQVERCRKVSNDVGEYVDALGKTLK